MWRAIWDHVSEWWKSPLTKTVVTTGLGGTVYGVLGLVEKLPKWLVSIAGTSAGPWVLGGLYILLLFSISAAAFYALKSRATTELADFLDSARQLYLDRGHYRLHEFDWHLQIKDDYSVSQTVRLNVSAGTKPLFALGFYRGSPNVAAPRLKDIRFHVRPSRGRVCWIPFEDNSNRKGFVVFPMPPIEPGEPARDLVVSDRWPNCANKLRQTGLSDTNEYTIPRQVVGSVGKVHIKITVPGNGRYRVSFRDSAEDLPNARGDLEREIELRDAEPGTVLVTSITKLA